MTKARLIKKQEAIEREEARKSQKKVVEKTINAMAGWLENQRAGRRDPRKAFADLFAHPQVQ